MLRKFKLALGKKERLFIMLSSLLILLVLAFDLFYPYKMSIKVDSSYLDAIFTSLSAISGISISILALLVGSIGRNFYGFTLSDIVLFSSNDYYFQNTIPWVFLLIIISLFTYIFNFPNLLTTLFVISILYIVIVSKQLWLLIFDRSQITDLIENEIGIIVFRNNTSEIIKTVQTIWKSTLNDVGKDIFSYDKDSIKYIKNLLVKIEPEVKNEVTIQMYNDLANFEFKYGLFLVNEIFFEIYFVLYPDEKSTPNNLEDVILNKFKDVLNVNFSEAIPTVMSIFSSGNYSKILKTSILYQTIMYIFYSLDALPETKKNYCVNLLSEYFDLIKYDEEIDFYKVNAILYIIKQFVLISESQVNGSILFTAFINVILRKLRFSNNDSIILLLGLIIYMLYVYGFYETETINEPQRDYILSLIQTNFSNIAQTNRDLSSLVRNEISLLNITLSKYANIEDFDDGLNFFPDWIDVKSSTWGFESWLRFQYILFLLSDEQVDFEPLFDNFEKHDIQKFRHARSFLLNEFVGSELKEHFHQEAMRVGRWLGIDTPPYLSVNIESSFRILNSKQLVEFKKEVSNYSVPNLNEVDVCNEINKRFQGSNIFKEQRDLQDKYFLVYPIEISYISSNYDSIDYLVDFFCKRIRREIHLYISDNITRFKLDKNLSNVNDLVKLIEQYDSYTFGYDYSIVMSIKKSEEYGEIEDAVRKLKKISSINEFNNMIFKAEDALLEIRVEQFKLTSLTDIEVDDQIKQYQVNSDYYRIMSAFVRIEEARDFIIKKLRKLELKYVFKTNFQNGSGLVIEYDYSDS